MNESHQQRVMDEKKELDEKLIKLNSFLKTPMFTNLISMEQARLRYQSIIMREYSLILEERISAFFKPEN